MKLRHAVALLSLSVSGLSFAVDQKAEPNCEVKGKKVAVKDEAACTKKKGTWLPAAAAAAPAADAAVAPAAAPAADAAAPAAEAPAAHKVEAEPKK